MISFALWNYLQLLNYFFMYLEIVKYYISCKSETNDALKFAMAEIIWFYELLSYYSSEKVGILNFHYFNFV